MHTKSTMRLRNWGLPHNFARRHGAGASGSVGGRRVRCRGRAGRGNDDDKVLEQVAGLPSKEALGSSGAVGPNDDVVVQYLPQASR